MNEYFMRLALVESLKSYVLDEVPVGCIITKDNKIIASSHNLRESTNNPLGHAELIAIREASKALGSWRLNGCTMYITLEPCIMCTGAIIDSRIEKLYIGASDPKRGAVDTFLPVVKERLIPHNIGHIEYMDTVSGYILKRFFKNLRMTKSSKKESLDFKG